VDEDDCPDLGTCSGGRLVLGRGARLELRGHAIGIAYQGTGVTCGNTVEARGRCTIVGPGRILGGKGTGVFGAAMTVELVDLSIENTDTAVRTAGWLLLKNVSVGGREDLIEAGKGIRAKHVRPGPAGIRSGAGLFIADVTLDQNAGSLEAAGRIVGRDVHSVGNLIAGREVALRRVTSEPELADLPDSLVTVRATGRVRLTDSVVGRVESGARPILRHTSCLTSAMLGAPSSWGICAGD
jgi:hypothetical protein